MLIGKFVSSSLMFLSGAVCAALILWLCFSYTSGQSENAMHRFRSALRQLAMYLVLGWISFAAMVALLAWRAGQPLSLVAVVPTETIDSTRNESPPATPLTDSPALPTPSEDRKSSVALNGPLIATSQLSQIKVPPAQVVQARDVLDASRQQLTHLVASIDARSQLGRMEVLMWRGAEGSRAKGIMAQVQANLKRGGYIYRETDAREETSTTVREFVAVSRARKKVVPGFWMITNEFLLLSWGEMKSKS